MIHSTVPIAFDFLLNYMSMDLIVHDDAIIHTPMPVLPNTKIQLFISIGCAVSSTGRGMATFFSLCFSGAKPQYFKVWIKLLQKAYLNRNVTFLYLPEGDMDFNRSRNCHNLCENKKALI